MRAWYGNAFDKGIGTGHIALGEQMQLFEQHFCIDFGEACAVSLLLNMYNVVD